MWSLATSCPFVGQHFTSRHGANPQLDFITLLPFCVINSLSFFPQAEIKKYNFFYMYAVLQIVLLIKKIKFSTHLKSINISLSSSSSSMSLSSSSAYKFY